MLCKSLVCAAFLLFSTISARADSLIGSDLTYSVQSLSPFLAVSEYPTPTGSFVVGDGSGFDTLAYVFVFDEFFPITVDFTATGLSVAVDSDTRTANFGDPGEILSIALTDAAFTAPFELTASAIIGNPHFDGPAGGLNVISLQGDTLTLQFRDLEYGDQYQIAEVVTPEPSSFALLGTGLFSVACIANRARQGF